MTDLLALIASDPNIAPEFREALPVVREACPICGGAGVTMNALGRVWCAPCLGRGYIVTERQS